MAVDIPIIAGAAAGGGGNPPPAIVTTLTRGAESALAEADQHRQAYIDHTTALAEAAHTQADDAAGTVWTDTTNQVIDLMGKADKAKDIVIKDITGQANAEMQKATDAVREVGGRPYVLIGDAVAANQAGSHWADAMNRMILPAIEQQRVIATSQPPPPPPFDVPIETTIQPNQPVPCGDGTAYPTVPPGYSLVDCDGQPWKEQPEGGGGVAVCVNGKIMPAFPARDDCGPTVPPTAPPTLAPPTAPPPPPAPTGECPAACPPPQIIVNVPPCSPPAGGSPPPPPGASPPPPGASPPPAVPPPTLDAEAVPVGPIDGPNMCAALDFMVNAAHTIQAAETNGQLQAMADSLSGIVGAMPGVGPLAGPVVGALVNDVSALVRWASSVTSTVGIPDAAAMTADMTLSSVTGFLERWMGFDTSYYQQPIRYATHAANPLNILGQSDIDAAYLGNAITVDQWTCLTRANGNAPWQHQQAMYVKRNRPGINELVQLRMRGDITPEVYYQRMRGEGVLDIGEANEYLSLAEQLPTLSDLMTWMVKDVANEQFVELAGLDDDFAESWTPELQALADKVGVSADQIKFSYRAQWQDIPLGQLFQMYWRLRPGRVPDNLVFTEKDLIFMMGIQEVQPRFRDKLKAIAYLPVNRTDLMAAFQAGTIDRTGLLNGFLDLGYSPVDAESLTRMMEVKAAGLLQSSLGAWTKRKIVKEYIGGSITRDVADRLLERTILDAQTRADALDDADFIRDAQRKAKCIAGTKRSYYTGEYNAVTARQVLANLGVELGVADNIIAGWTCEREHRSKEPTVKMLTAWVSQGILTWDQFGQRLSNLGYTQDDVVRIRISTDLDIRQAQSKAAAAAAQKAEAKAEKVAKAAQKAVDDVKKKVRQRHMDLDHNKEKHKGPDPGPMPLDQVE